MNEDARVLARLFRYVEPRELPSSSTVAHLDKKNNLVRINRELFERLADHQKAQVYSMQDGLIEIDWFNS